MTGNDWLVITVEAPSEALKDALVEGLLALGGSAVQEAGQTLITYVRPPGDVASWLDRARTALSAAADGEAIAVDWRWQAAEDWSQTWKRGLRPRRVGRRFVITPSWERVAATGDDLIIIIDPEMAFGTGEHATTRAALRFLERIVRPDDRILDVGTGSAILAIGAARLGAARVVAVDHDADAVLNARDNVTRNGVSSIVQLEEGLVDADYLRAAGSASFDVIAANVLSSVLRPLLVPFFQALRPGGHAILGGILQHEADQMLDACARAGFSVIAEDLEEEWWGVLLRHPSSEPD